MNDRSLPLPDNGRLRRSSGIARAVLVMLCVPLSIWAALLGIAQLDDGSRLSQGLADSSRESTVMVCGSGRVVHEGDSLIERIFGGSGSFRCTDWRMRGTGSGTAQPQRASWPSSPRR